MMAKANEAPIWTVKTLVVVRNPGPMALVAISIMAPYIAPRRGVAALRTSAWVMR